jgi:hypothetical protein
MKKSLFFGVLLLSATASAEPSSNASANGAGAGADPNQMICRNQRETGSMLARTRVCKTRAQWEADRRDTRQTIDRNQTNRVNRGE